MFGSVAGVLQGDTLAPYLFIIALDYCMRQALSKHPDIGFTIKPRQSSRKNAEKISDTDFADDIALITDDIADAEILMQEVEKMAATAGLHMNESKTKFMTVNIENPSTLTSVSGKNIEHVEDFTYLGCKIKESESDIRVRKGKAWGACHSLAKLWKSNLRDSLKIRVFLALVESVLFYGSETWTMTKRLNKIIDGCYTRMLRMALNVNQYKQRLNNNCLYNGLPKASSKIKQRRLRLAGHAQRHPELTLNKVILWEPQHGRASRGRPQLTFIDNLQVDTGLTSTKEMAQLMGDRYLWRQLVQQSQELYRYVKLIVSYFFV